MLFCISLHDLADFTILVSFLLLYIDSLFSSPVRVLHRVVAMTVVVVAMTAVVVSWHRYKFKLKSAFFSYHDFGPCKACVFVCALPANIL